MKKIIFTSNAPAAIGPYSQAVEINGFIYISGQLGIDPSSGNLINGVDKQAEQSMKNIKSILDEIGLNLSNIVKTTIFLTDMTNFAKINEVYGKYFDGNFPSRSTIQVSALPKGGLVEIEAIATR